MAEARARAGWEALGKAQAHAAAATPVEQALIAALAKRFDGPKPLDPSNSAPLLAAYVTAMEGVARRFPDDMDVQTMFAEGLMNTNPWKLWTADGKPGPGTPAILAALQKVLARDPKHPGANHYWIHAVEASTDPARATPSAEALVGMMPAAGHLEHMPAHIFQRVGRYEEAAEANRKGAAADVAYLGLTAPPDYYPMYLIHNYQFLAYSAAMEGRRAETIDALRSARAAVPDSMLLAMPGLDWSIGYLYDGMVRFGRWDEILAEPAPNPKLAGLTIGWMQARATALAAKGRIAEAKALLSELDRAIAAVPAEARQGQNAAKPLYEIGALKAKARIALAEDRRDAAIASRVTLPNVSVTDGLNNRSIDATARPSSGPWRKPANTASGSRRCSHSRAGPSPTTRTLCRTCCRSRQSIVSEKTSSPFSITSRPTKPITGSSSAKPSSRRQPGSRRPGLKISRSMPRVQMPTL
jgi:tetratricopeptide (TPR) repeat protein